MRLRDGEGSEALNPGIKPLGLFVGLLTLDIEYLVEDLPEPNAKVVAVDQEVDVGGPGTNAARAFCALGGNATLVTRVGINSAVGASIPERLSESGIRVLDPGGPGGCELPVSSILVESSTGDRSVVSINATKADLKVSREAAGDFVERVDVLLVDGHHMDAGVEVAQVAKQAGVPVVFDAGSWKPGTEELLPWCDWIVCSEGFGLEPSQPGPRRRGMDLIDDLLRYGPTGVAITRGGAPILWGTEGKRGEIPIDQDTPVVDTLGAGDVFHGAFAYAIACDRDFRSSLGFASKAATDSCRYFGVRRWLIATQSDHFQAI